MIEESYMAKLLFYAGVLMLPAILMTLIIVTAPDSALSPLSDNPSKFLFFIAYFLPGLALARTITDSWRKTIGIGIAYAIISPAYYMYAIEYACRITETCIAV